MNKKVVTSVLAAVSVITASLFISADSFAAVEPKYWTPAFPTAEGSAKYIDGARAEINNTNAVEIYHVTNLNDDGAGSFRDAVSRGNRMIVFDVSGMIDLKSRVSITHDNITILGQTAPGDGICFRGNSVKINGSNIILRYLRFRPGSKLADGSDTITQDGFSIPVGASDVILDHCSISWGTDENLSIIGGKRITVQRCIISEALNSSIHDKGEHSYAGIWGGMYISMHHNIIASHKSRNPKIGTSETVSMTPGHTDNETVVDMWNNVFYNWGDKAGYGAENGANVNIVNNYYKPGPATPSNKRARIFELSAGNKYQPNWSADIYASGNFIDDDGADAAAVNEDNWQIERGTGVYLASPNITYNKLDELPGGSELKYMYPSGPVESIQTAKEAYEDVLADVGAALPKQDLVDARIIDNVKNRTAPEHGSHGSSYLVDDPVDAVPEGREDLYDDRGYPIWVSETRAADFDADGDGIADAWEDKMGLDKTNPNDSLNLGPNGYTWLEIYGESFVSDNTADTAVDVKDNGNGEYTLSVNDTSAVKTAFYVDDTPYSDDMVLEIGQLNGAEYGDTVIVASYKDNAPVEVKTEVYSDQFIMPEVSGKDKRVFIWDSLAGMRPVGIERAETSSTGTLGAGMYMVSAKLTYADGTYKITPAVQLTVKGEEAQPQAVSGDFEVIGGLYDIPNLLKNVYSGIYADDFVIAAGYNDEFKPVIKYGKKSNAELSEKDNKGYKYIKISVKNNHADLYAASTIGLWDKLSENGYDYKGSDPTAGKYVINPENKDYASRVVCKVITDFTAPEFTVDNIADNSVIGFNDTVKVSTLENWLNAVVLFNGEIIATSDDAKIDKPLGSDTLTLDIPVSFGAAQEGTLTVMCYNDNYQSTSKSFRVYVSADASPWQVTDISADGNMNRAYMYATEDYTFKIGGMDGNIGGTSDEFGYVYQKFTGDSRIYYRSRMQDGKQFGIMLRKSLDPDSEAYFFGGENNGDITYSVKSRDTKGSEMVSEAVEGLSGDTTYIIAEKQGNSLNIYRIDEKNTISDKKTLIKTVDVSALGDEYYMGFAAVTDGTGNPPDCGWIGIDNSADSWYVWNFNNGLDWQWQIQERNVLKPEWEYENGQGRMVLAPDDNYSGERYIFREYFMEDGYNPFMVAKVCLTGEEPAMNIYLQTGDANTAYKLTFDSDNKVKDAEGNEIAQWQQNETYFVGMSTEIDSDTLEYVCKAAVIPDDPVATGESVKIPADSRFRPQNNIQKKTPVTRAVYFEPVASANGKYYIDHVLIEPVKSEIDVEKTERFLNFDSLTVSSTEEYTTENGFTVSAGMAVTDSKKNIGDKSFNKRIQMDKGSATSKAISFDVDGNAQITLYASQGGTSGERHAIIDNGAEKLQTIIGEMNAYTVDYKGEAGKLTLYSDSKIYIYGIKITERKVMTKK